MQKRHINTLDSKKSWLKPPLSQKIKSGYVILHKGEEIGEHTTDEREEVLYIIEGEATVTVEGNIQMAESGSVIYISPNKKHNVKNEADEDLKYIYVVTHFK